MSGKYLLDTNIVIALFAEDPSVQKHMAKASEIFIPATVIGELFYGAFKSERHKANTARIEEFASSTPSLLVTLPQAESSDKSRTSCIKRGIQYRRTISGLPL